MSDDSLSFHQRQGAPPALDAERILTELTPVQALDLLGNTPYGRVVFTKDSLPAIRPVNHLIDNGDIIIRTRIAAKISTAMSPGATVVAYQADQFDPVTGLGWSVTATGYATAVTGADETARLSRMLTPWVNMTMDTIIRIRPEIIAGFRLTEIA